MGDKKKTTDAKIYSTNKDQSKTKVELHYYYKVKPNGNLGFRKKYVKVEK